ncbi:MAG: hypothetical protein ABL974_20045 [Prosthecobacter sp.]
MLNIQKEKRAMHAHLKEEGLDEHEIKQRLTNDLKPFTPAFINGKHIERDSISDDELGKKIKATEGEEVESIESRL